MNEAIFIKRNCIENDALLKHIIESQNKIRNSLHEIETRIGQAEWYEGNLGVVFVIDVDLECLQKYCDEIKMCASELYGAYEKLANRISAEQHCD